MYCWHCGERTIDPEQRYCHRCGALLSAADARALANRVADGSTPAPTDPRGYWRGLGPWPLTAPLVVAGGLVVGVLFLAATAIAVAFAGMVVASLAAFAPLVLVIVALYVLLGAGSRHHDWI